MTFEGGEIWQIIRDHLARIYPQTLVTSDLARSFTARIATRVTHEQVQQVLAEMEADSEVVVYRSERLGLAEVSAVGGPEYYREIAAAEDGGYAPAASPDLTGPHFLRFLDLALDRAETSISERMSELEHRYMSKMLQAFGVMAAVFALIVTVAGLSGGLFDLHRVVLASMNAWVALVYLMLTSVAVFLPVGLIALILINSVSQLKPNKRHQ